MSYLGYLLYEENFVLFFISLRYSVDPLRDYGLRVRVHETMQAAWKKSCLAKCWTIRAKKGGVGKVKLKF